MPFFLYKAFFIKGKINTPPILFYLSTANNNNFDPYPGIPRFDFYPQKNMPDSPPSTFTAPNLQNNSIQSPNPKK